jgi:hypothetical protein
MIEQRRFSVALTFHLRDPPEAVNARPAMGSRDRHFFTHLRRKSDATGATGVMIQCELRCYSVRCLSVLVNMFMYQSEYESPH